MTISICFLAKLQEECNSQGLQLAPNEVLKASKDALTVGAVRKYLAEEKQLEVLRFVIDARAAVNGEFSSEDQILNDEDELAFLPPFSGG